LGDSAFEIAAFVTASAGVVLVVLFVGWYVAVRRRSVSRLKVSDGHGVLLGADGGELVIIVRAENIGSLPIEVTGWGFRSKRGRVLVPADPLPASTQVPVVLQPGEDASFFVPMRDFERALRDAETSSARPFVTVIARTDVRARHRVRPVATVAVARNGTESARADIDV